jgi:hypothetical protein
VCLKGSNLELCYCGNSQTTVYCPRCKQVAITNYSDQNSASITAAAMFAELCNFGPIIRLLKRLMKRYRMHETGANAFSEQRYPEFPTCMPPFPFTASFWSVPVVKRVVNDPARWILITAWLAPHCKHWWTRGHPKYSLYLSDDTGIKTRSNVQISWKLRAHNSHQRNIIYTVCLEQTS